jgi:hypothetical protein
MARFGPMASCIHSKGLIMRKAIKTIGLSLAGIVAVLAGVWFTNLFGLKEGIYVSQIVKMRVAPERLTNPKTPQDYGMAYTDVEIMTRIMCA